MVAKKEKATKDATVTAVELADWLALSPKAIFNHALTGIVVRTPVRGRYLLKASVKKYSEHIREAATGRGSVTANARARLLEAQALAAEDKRAAARGDTLSAAEVVKGWSAIVRRTRSAILAAPVRCAARLPHLTPHDLATLDGELRGVLTELGSGADAA